MSFTCSNESLLCLPSDVLKEILEKYVPGLGNIVRLDSAVNNRGLRRIFLESLAQICMPVRIHFDCHAYSTRRRARWLSKKRIRITHVVAEHLSKNGTKWLVKKCSFILKHLLILETSRIEDWQDGWWRRLLTRCVNLIELRVIEVRSMYATLHAAATCCPQLQILVLHGHESTIDSGDRLTKFVEKCHSLKEVYFISCQAPNIQCLVDKGIAVLAETYSINIQLSWHALPGNLTFTSRNVDQYLMWCNVPSRLQDTVKRRLKNGHILATNATCFTDYFLLRPMFWQWPLQLHLDSCENWTEGDFVRASQLPNILAVSFYSNSSITNLPPAFNDSKSLKVIAFCCFPALTMNALRDIRAANPALSILTFCMPQIVSCEGIRAYQVGDVSLLPTFV